MWWRVFMFNIGVGAFHALSSEWWQWFAWFHVATGVGLIVSRVRFHRQMAALTALFAAGAGCKPPIL